MNILNNSTYKVTLFASILIIITIIILDFIFKPQLGDILVEAHGLMFDIILFGLIIGFYDLLFRRKEKEAEEKNKIEEKIQRHLEEIRDFAAWESDESKYRISGNIRRLNNLGISKIDIEVCDLSNLDLSNLNLQSSCISRFNLTNAKINIGNLSRFIDETTLITYEANLSYINLKNSTINFYSNATIFLGCNFNNSTMSGELNLTDLSPFKFSQNEIIALKTNLRKTHIQAKEIESQTIINKFENSTLENIEFRGSILKEVTFEGATIKDSIFAPQIINKNEIDTIIKKLVYLNIDIEEIESQEIKTKLNNTNFRNTILKNVSFHKSDLSGANFENANIIDCNFRGSILIDTIFNKELKQMLVSQDVDTTRVTFI